VVRVAPGAPSRLPAGDKPPTAGDKPPPYTCFYTSGELPLRDAQKRALLAFVKDGNGYLVTLLTTIVPGLGLCDVKASHWSRQAASP
jgi:hypothetical protein